MQTQDLDFSQSFIGRRHAGTASDLETCHFLWERKAVSGQNREPGEQKGPDTVTGSMCLVGLQSCEGPVTMTRLLFSPYLSTSVQVS